MHQEYSTFARSLSKNNCVFFQLLNQMDGFDALGQVKDVFHFSGLSSSNNLDVDNRIP